MGVLQIEIGLSTAFSPRLPPEATQQAASRVLRWLDRQRQRAALAELDDRLLADIGVNRASAEAESRRWD
ncbi:MAG: DUF1127 domain-containing protein [Thalassobaculum sp.]|uniref:DUF1127 domain-containing protein n=1 Tax=Thalassobaculum sp. TaxID=2022740 RepID=UPI0032EDEC81